MILFDFFINVMAAILTMFEMFCQAIPMILFLVFKSYAMSIVNKVISFCILIGRDSQCMIETKYEMQSGLSQSVMKIVITHLRWLSYVQNCSEWYLYAFKIFMYASISNSILIMASRVVFNSIISRKLECPLSKSVDKYLTTRVVYKGFPWERKVTESFFSH